MPKRSRSMLRLFGATLLALVLSVAMAGALQANTITPVASAEGISEYILDNGMRVVLFPDNSSPVTTVNVTYLVGSRHENYGETGMAHLLEHLVFKGTPTHPDIPAEFRQRGISFNGTTWLDRTNYFGSFATNPETLDWLLGLEADRMVNSHISREDLDSEMTVVRNEMESGENNPIGVLFQRILSTAYLWHNYGNSTIGARADVENVPIERLQAFYRAWYQPDNAVLVIAGDFDADTTLARIADTFGGIPRPQRTLQTTYTRDPAQDGERRVHVRRVGNTDYVGLGYHIPAGRHADSAALAVLSQALGHTPTGRLHKTLVENGQATGVMSMNLSMDEPGIAIFVAESPDGGDPDALESALVALLDGATADPFTETEVAEARQRLLTAHERSMRDPNAIGVALSEAIAQGDWRLFLLSRDRTETVTADDVNRVFRTYFKPDNRTVGRFIPTERPDRVVIAEAPSASELLAGYEGREALAAGESFDASPANIDARTITHTLANGAEIALLPKSTRGQSVQLQIVLRLGDEASLTGRAEAGNAVPGMLMRGTSGLDRAAISSRLLELKSTLGISGGATSVSVTGNTDRDNLPALLELAATLLRSPTFPESELEQLRSQAITSIRSNMTEPQAIASQAASRYFNRWPKGHPLYVSAFEESLETLQNLRLQELIDFHRDFYGADNAKIAIVGDFDADEVHAQLAELLGGWSAAMPFARIASPHYGKPAVRQSIETPDKPNAMFIASLPVPVGQEHPDYAALVLGNRILGGGSLKSRLADRIRQQDGLSYGVGSSFSASVLDESGNFVGYAIAAPENIAPVETAFREELQRLIEDGIADDELAEALDGLLRQRQTARADDASVASQLASNLYFDRTFAHAAEFESELSALDAETVRAAVERTITPDDISIFVAGDFAGAQPRDGSDED